jgi:hypothetical protein
MSRLDLDSITSRCSSPDELEDEETQKLIIALANRSYHLPGYGLWADLCQYLNNNHPLLGIFCHHRLHPIKTRMRLLTLFGSILFGLTVSNIFFLLVLSDERFQEKMFAVTINEEEWYITSGMVMLWTVGGSVHASYDIMIWYIVACACCPFSKKFRLYGSFLVGFAIVLLLAMTSLIVLVRASLQHEENDNLDLTQLDSAGLVDDQVVLVDIKKEDVRFLLGYVTEFALALIVYYPLGSLILFSGILGCGKLPILGGRPRDMLVHQKMVKHREKMTLPSA